MASLPDVSMDVKVIELNVDFIYWIVWGVAFTIETINLLSSIHFETDDEEDNNK